MLSALALLVPAASCVPETHALQSAGSVASLSIDLPPATPASASLASATTASGPAAAPTVFRSATLLDELRALDCLAQAVYYEARSETEDGQRAVAQVVLNRVRHPAYPGSVCGVVYQGPMKAGGGCQFTFTCDGALAQPPFGPGWSRARRIAAEALAGKVFAPVGLATHYHRLDVAPEWAPRLAPVATIGVHIFYRWNGMAGSPAAFRQAYAGHEPVPEPAVRFAAAEPAPALAAPGLPALRLAYVASDIAPAPPPTASSDRLPQSRVRAQYLNSGAWRSDPAKAPAAE